MAIKQLTKQSSQARYHRVMIYPVLDGRYFQAICSCHWISENMETHPEAWLAGSIHCRNVVRTGTKTREPRWVARRHLE